LAKNQDPALGSVIRSMLMMLRATEGLLRSILPATADAICEQLQLEPTTEWSKIGEPETLPTKHPLGRPKPIFPRIDVKRVAVQKGAEQAAPAPQERQPVQETQEETIDISLLSKIQLKVACIEGAEEVEGSSKLLKLSVTLGSEKRQIIAGIRGSYSPKELVGKQVVLVANLKPAKVRGQMSYGMLLAADGPQGEAILLTTDRQAPEGANVH
jgi:methionyl-tRNA synthetase